MHINRRQEDIGNIPSSKVISSEKKYNRDQIINAKYFSRKEREFLTWLLTDEEYTISQVKELVKKEMERTVD